MANGDEVGKDCPLPNSHRRLLDAHTLWHAAEEAYANEELFRIHLNSLIQTLRNTTWMLQNEKHAIQDFDVWYAAWQDRMKADDAMRWLVDARNDVVKHGDLATRSTARVGILASWYGSRLLGETEVPAVLGPRDVAAHLSSELKDKGRSAELQRAQQEDAAIVVERRWVVDKMPDRELLELLAHCFSVLAELLNEAHVRISSRETPIEPRPACMQVTREARTAHIRFSTGEVSTPATQELSVDMKEVTKRYGSDLEYAEAARAAVSASDPFAFAPAAFEQAKRILTKDKNHGPVVLLFIPGGGLRPIMVEFEDQTDKYLKWESIASEVERTGATGLVFIAEAWTGSAEGGDAQIPPSRRKDRGEVLIVTAASADGRHESRVARFERGFLGRIRFTGESILKDDTMNVLEPVRRVWNRRKA
jgi:hypothetical protein